VSIDRTKLEINGDVINIMSYIFCYYCFRVLDTEGGSQRATLIVVVVVVISSLKIPKAFLIRSGAAERNETLHTQLHIGSDIPHRSTVSDNFLINE